MTKVVGTEHPRVEVLATLLGEIHENIAAKVAAERDETDPQVAVDFFDSPAARGGPLPRIAGTVCTRR